MNDTVDRFYQATGEWMVKSSDYDALSARCDELERRLAGAWVVRELEWVVWKQTDAYECLGAETPFGTMFAIGHPGKGDYSASCNGTKEIFVDSLPSLDAAKAAAQAWYESRLTAGLRRAGG